MAATSRDRVLSVSIQAYRLLLIVYPPQFRGEYGPSMAQVFRDACRDAYRQRQTAGLAWLWLATLADLIVTAAEERLAGPGGPSHMAHQIGVGIAAGMAGGAAAGLAARVAMRGVALAGGLPLSFTVEGTLNLAIVGLVFGIPFGIAFVALRRFIPGSGPWQGLGYGALLFAIFLAPPFLFYREGEASLLPRSPSR